MNHPTDSSGDAPGDSPGDKVKQAETMLTNAIQKRQKSLAQMALETLGEIAPEHPRMQEYEIWVRDLDQEVALQQRVDSIVGEARAALQKDDVEAAREQLRALRKLDPWNEATDRLAEEIDEAEHGAEVSAGIGRVKESIDEALENEDLQAARAGLETLNGTDVPKITVDTYRRRVDELARQLQDRSDARELEARYQDRVDAHDWQGAREVAREYGRRFPDDDHGTELFNRVAELEAGERREASVRQGIAQVEQFVAAGDKAMAETALRVVKNMGSDAGKVAELEAKIRNL